MTPAMPIQTQDPQTAPQVQADATAQPQDNTDVSPSVSDVPEENAVAGESVNLQRSYSKLNSAIAELFDSLGIHRSATIPHIFGENMAKHMEAVSSVLPTIGGVTANLLTATHTKHDPNGGATIAHPAQKLRETIIPKNDEHAIAAIAACRNFVNKAAFLLGDDDPTVKTAKSQLDLIGKFNMAGMTAWDAGAALLSVPGPLIAKIARLHSEAKHGRVHPALTAPKGK